MNQSVETVQGAGNLARSQYIAAQALRTAWYGAHYALARRMSSGFQREGEPAFVPSMGTPDRKALRDAYFGLFRKDRKNIEDGLYPAPPTLEPGTLAKAMRKSRRFLSDVSKVDRRRQERSGTEVRDLEGSDRYPTYYRQNFHYQSGGWLTDESAEIYDTQVEVLFTGAADAMRRIVLGELARVVRGRNQSDLRYLDLACGTGRFLNRVLDAFPKLNATGIDLSPAYAAKARSAVRKWRQADILEGQAEHLPFADDSQDIVTCIYLFHELPPRIRPKVAAEIARVLKPSFR